MGSVLQKTGSRTHLIVISGLSGSGKSIALRLLEDSGYYCVDNLPCSLLSGLLDELEDQGIRQIAVAMDTRSGRQVENLPHRLATLRREVPGLCFLFLDASDDVLLKRYSETRRRHPMAHTDQTLLESIRAERRLLAPLSALGHRIDSSHLRPAGLRRWVLQFVDIEGQEVGRGGGGQKEGKGRRLTLLFESFGFKHGLPQDADLVFDVRCLPNPYYDPHLRPLTGQDTPVADFLEAQDDVRRLREDIESFLRRWLPAYQQDNRAYLTVAIGCTGGQHRSVYLAEWLAKRFQSSKLVPPLLPLHILVRHRTLDGMNSEELASEA